MNTELVKPMADFLKLAATTVDRLFTQKQDLQARLEAAEGAAKTASAESTKMAEAIVVKLAAAGYLQDSERDLAMQKASSTDGLQHMLAYVLDNQAEGKTTKVAESLGKGVDDVDKSTPSGHTVKVAERLPFGKRQADQRLFERAQAMRSRQV